MENMNKIERLKDLMTSLGSSTYYLMNSPNLKSSSIPIFDSTNPASLRTIIETADVGQLRQIIMDQNKAICDIYNILGEILEGTLNKYPNH